MEVKGSEPWAPFRQLSEAHVRHVGAIHEDQGDELWAPIGEPFHAQVRHLFAVPQVQRSEQWARRRQLLKAQVRHTARGAVAATQVERAATRKPGDFQHAGAIL